jgi:hypothetical protein
MICELVRQGKRVGVTAVGHKVIHHLLEEVVDAAKKMGLHSIACGHKNEGDGIDGDGVRAIATNEEALQLLQSGEVNVLGGTSFMWAREEFSESVNVLFVDEAGQMSLANVLACAPAGNSLVLLGDPQQLEQPQKGSHPEGSDISALAHLLNGRKTIEPDRGLFYGDHLASPSRQSVNSRRNCSTKDGWFHAGGLKSSAFERPTLFRERASGSSPSIMMEIKAIQRKRSTESPPSLSTSLSVEPLG